MVNYLAWDGERHIPVDPKVFMYLSGKNILEWKNRINEKVRYKEVMEMLRGVGGNERRIATS